MDTVRLTAEMIEQGKSDVGGWTKRQIQALGLEWPPHHNWKGAVIGKLIEAEALEEFLALKNTSKRMRRKKEGRDRRESRFPGIDRLEVGEMLSVEIEGKRFAVRRTA